MISETIVQYHLTLCIPKKLDEANMDCGNFVDLQKVSKTVEYGILLSKLENHGIRGLSNEWPTSSLPNWKQYVLINDYDSNLPTVKFDILSSVSFLLKFILNIY